MRGKIINYFPGKGFGFIKSLTVDYFFHASQALSINNIRLGLEVDFEVEEGPDGRLRAIKVVEWKDHRERVLQRPTSVSQDEVTQPSNSTSLCGEIVNLVNKDEYGFILDQDKNERYFNYKDFLSDKTIRIGMLVSFEPFSMTRGGLRARKIWASQNQNSFLLYTEMSNWKKEARSDNMLKYFYQVNYLAHVESGSACYVVGRKGSGKTAIGEYILKSKKFNRFSKRLSFKNVPFNKLYRQEDKDFTFPNQYQTMWKYVIYNQLAKMLIENESISEYSKNDLCKTLCKYDDSFKFKAKKNVISRNFNIKIFGSGIGIGSGYEPAPELSLSSAVDVLEEQIIDCLDQSQYFLVFDELDEDFKSTLNRDEHHKYAALLTSLFKAVQDVKSIFHDYQVLPIVLLRDDIFRMLEDPDRTKWKDLSVELVWNEKSLKDLLAFRIEKAIDQKINATHPRIIFRKVFEKETITRDAHDLHFFEFITSLTLMRPRDYVEFIRICSSLCNDKHEDIITESILFEAEDPYSKYFRSELEDEVHGVIPEIKTIFEILSHMGKRIFKRKEFVTVYQSRILDCTAEKIDNHLKKMFEFSIIGIKRVDGDDYCFNHLNSAVLYDGRRGYKIHPGLYKSLNIL